MVDKEFLTLLYQVGYRIAMLIIYVVFMVDVKPYPLHLGEN